MEKYNFNTVLYNICLEKLKQHDKYYITRKRKLNTFIIFQYLFNSMILNSGVSTITHLYNLCSHTAVIKSRLKFQPDLFYNINFNLPHKNSIYAIDGSKIRVHLGFLKYGYKTRTCDSSIRCSKRPLLMCSALLGIQTDTIVDYTITKHFNERLEVYKLVQNLSIGDIILMDRGYFSSELYYYLYKKHFIPIFRLKCDANKTVSKFYRSNKNNLFTYIKYNNEFIPIRYCKYYIEDNTYLIATTVNNLSNNKIKKLYNKRWRIEVAFKRLKSHLHINKIYSTSEFIYKQELQFRILIDTLTKRTYNNIINTSHKNIKHQQFINYKYVLFKYILFYVFKILEWDVP